MFEERYKREQEIKKQEFKNKLWLLYTIPFFAFPNLLLSSAKVIAYLLFWILCIIILVGWIKGVPLDITNFVRW